MKTLKKPGSNDMNQYIVMISIAAFFLWGLIALFYPAGAIAQEGTFPTRPVVVISPFGPGGGTSTELRNLAPYVQKYLGQPMIIKAMPGGGTTIGAAAAARAKPDGYTILCPPQPTTLLAQLMNKADYHLEKFEYIYAWFEGPMDVIVNVKTPYKTFAELLAASKKKPIKMSTAGVGSISQLMAMLLGKYTGLRYTLVPYQGGGPSTVAVVRGDVEALSGLSTTSVRFVRDKKVRDLAILGPKRLKAMPNTQTIYELGYKDFPYVPFVRGVAAPPGAPSDRVKILAEAFKKAVDDPGFRAIMEKQGRPVSPMSQEAWGKFAQTAFQMAEKYVPLMIEAQTKK